MTINYLLTLEDAEIELKVEVAYTPFEPESYDCQASPFEIEILSACDHEGVDYTSALTDEDVEEIELQVLEDLDDKDTDAAVSAYESRMDARAEAAFERWMP